MNLAVFGLGKLGSPLAAWFASAGHHVFGIDPSSRITSLLSAGQAPVAETGLQELLAEIGARIDCDCDPVEAASRSDFVFLIVPTPSNETGEFSNDFLVNALKPVAEAIRNGAHPLVVVVSTVMPGTTENVLIPFLEHESGRACGIDFDVCYNPEFIALGSVLADMASPSFILIGESSCKAGESLEAFYRNLHAVLGNPVPPIARMGLVNAEICKLSVNCFVTSKISYANQLAALCEQVPGANASVICKAIGLDRRINPHFLKPGACYGGPCFPRDNVALRVYSERVGVTMPLAVATDEVNRQTTERLFNMVMAVCPQTVAILGLSYKPDTPVTEESQAIELLKKLSQQRLGLYAHDPAADRQVPLVAHCDTVQEAVSQADVVVITTAWEQYRHLDPEWFQPGTRIVDCWGILPSSFHDCGYRFEIVELGKHV